MSLNDVQEGKILTLTAPTGGVVSGNGYKIGGLFVVALITAAASTPFTGARTGVHALAKTAPEAWTEGQKLYWDDSGKKVTSTSGSNQAIGHATEITDSAATEGKVCLSGTGS